IVGALGIAEDAVSRPTDEEGRGVLEFVRSDLQRFHVRAHGFWSRTLEIPQEGDGPVPVTLDRGNQLIVEVVGLQSSSFDDMAFRRASVSPLFATSGRWQPEWHLREVLAGSCHIAYLPGEARAKGIAVCGFDDRGRFIAEDLKPGEPLTLQVFGPLESILHE